DVCSSDLKVNPNYPNTNVDEQQKDQDSILNFYKKLIRIRKENEVFVYGMYELLEPNHPHLFVYTRTLDEEKAIVINNFAEQVTKIELPEWVKDAQLVLNNYDVQDAEIKQKVTLNPYESRVYLLKA